MDFSETKKVLDVLYMGIDGFQISAEAIKKLPFFYPGLYYDEVTFKSFYKILLKVKRTKNKNFYDLGCGVGKKVFISAFCCDFSKAIGIELLRDLYLASKKVLTIYEKRVKPKLSEEKQQCFINFILGDYNKYDFSDGDAVFISLSEAAMAIELKGILGKKLEKLKKGYIVITTGSPFLSSSYTLRFFDSCGFRTHKSLVFLHEKIR